MTNSAYVSASWRHLSQRQAEDRFWKSMSSAFRKGYDDCMGIPSKVIFDSVHNEYDHDFNPYVTRSDEWIDYRAGCKEYYDRYEKYNEKGGGVA